MFKFKQLIQICLIYCFICLKYCLTKKQLYICRVIKKNNIMTKQEQRKLRELVLLTFVFVVLTAVLLSIQL